MEGHSVYHGVNWVIFIYKIETIQLDENKSHLDVEFCENCI